MDAPSGRRDHAGVRKSDTPPADARLRRPLDAAQLVRADNGFHLWSATYDRDLKDVFKVQDDIARVVVDKLKVTLAGGIPTTAARTENTEAHNLLLQGNFPL